MTYIMLVITLATRDDIAGILNLQEQNLLERGGLLSVRLPGPFIEAALDDLPQIVARSGWQGSRLSAGGIARRARSSTNHTGDVPRLSGVP